MNYRAARLLAAALFSSALFLRQPNLFPAADRQYLALPPQSRIAPGDPYRSISVGGRESITGREYYDVDLVWPTGAAAGGCGRPAPMVSFDRASGSEQPVARAGDCGRVYTSRPPSIRGPDRNHRLAMPQSFNRRRTVRKCGPGSLSRPLCRCRSDPPVLRAGCRPGPARGDQFHRTARLRAGLLPGRRPGAAAPGNRFHGRPGRNPVFSRRGARGPADAAQHQPPAHASWCFRAGRLTT